MQFSKRTILKASGFDISLQIGGNFVKDDAVYCEHPGGVEMAYIAYWRHRALMRKQRQIIKGLSLALGVVVVMAVALIVKGV